MNIVLPRKYNDKVKILRACFQFFLKIFFSCRGRKLETQGERKREREKSLCTKSANINQLYTTNIGKIGECHTTLRQKASLVCNGINNGFQI